MSFIYLWSYPIFHDGNKEHHYVRGKDGNKEHHIYINIEQIVDVFTNGLTGTLFKLL